jgi:hypothetical protein
MTGPVVVVSDGGVVGVGDVVPVGVVVVGVGVVLLGCSWTSVRGTQVKFGSGTNPGGTTWVDGASVDVGWAWNV